MRRRVVIAVLTLFVVGAAATNFAIRRFRGLRDTNTNIALRQSYQGPATMPAAVEDWPKWRGPRGDGISRETIAENWPKGGPKVLWSADVGLGFSSPIAQAGKVYLFNMNDEKETLTCFDARSGEIVWSEEDPDGGWTKSYPGARATPTIHGTSVYTYGGNGTLTSRDVATGKAQWSRHVLRDTGAQPLDWGQTSSPLVTEKHIYVQGGQGGPIALAFDHAGTPLWQSQAAALADTRRRS